MDSCALYRQKNCTKFGDRDWNLSLTSPHHVRVTLGKALRLLEPCVLSSRIFVRIKEVSVHEKHFVIRKVAYTC